MTHTNRPLQAPAAPNEMARPSAPVGIISLDTVLGDIGAWLEDTERSRKVVRQKRAGPSAIA